MLRSLWVNQGMHALGYDGEVCYSPIHLSMLSSRLVHLYSGSIAIAPDSPACPCGHHITFESLIHATERRGPGRTTSGRLWITRSTSRMRSQAEKNTSTESRPISVIFSPTSPRGGSGHIISLYIMYIVPRRARATNCPIPLDPLGIPGGLP